MEQAPGALLFPSSPEDEVYTRAAKAALRTLFRLLSNLLPAETRLLPQVAPEAIRRRVEPMVMGLVQRDWQEVALREIVPRTFVLNFQGAKAAIDAELSTCFMGSAWRILWALFGDSGLKPDDIDKTAREEFHADARRDHKEFRCRRLRLAHQSTAAAASSRAAG